MEQSQVKVPISSQRTPLALNLARFLKGNKILKERVGLMNNTDDFDFFRYKRLIRALQSDEYKAQQANPKNGLPEISDEQEAQKVSIMLLQNQMYVPVQTLHYAEIKEVRGWKPNKTKPTLKRIEKAALESDAYFAWTYTKPNPYILLYSILTIVGVFTVILFPLWPNFMKRGVWYLSMAALGLIAMFFATAIVRLIIYIISLVAFPKPFWLFPNLFEDCGVIESFKPLYAWEEKKVKKSKKKAEKGENIAESVPSSGSSSGASTSSGDVVKRKVTLEEVSE